MSPGKVGPRLHRAVKSTSVDDCSLVFRMVAVLIYMSQAHRDANTLANAYAAISNAGAAGLTSRQIRDSGTLASDFAIEQLLARRMIVKLSSVVGRDCVDARYSTVRNAQ